jgi:hypothetical protein
MPYTVFAELAVTVQLAPLTWLQPDQPMKMELASGAAVRTTVSPLFTGAVHVPTPPVEQLKPAPEMVPPPAPLKPADTG